MEVEISKNSGRKTARDQYENANEVKVNYAKLVASVSKAIDSGKMIDGRKIDDIHPKYFKLDGKNREVDTTSVSFAALKRSLNENGLLHPIIFNFVDGDFIVVSGHRRLAAVKDLGWEKIPAIYKSDISKRNDQRFDENVLREDLNPIEYCEQILYLKNSGEFDSQQKLADRIGINKSDLSSFIKISAWSNDIKKFAIDNGLGKTSLKLIARKANADVLKEIQIEIKKRDVDSRKSENREKKAKGKVSVLDKYPGIEKAVSKLNSSKEMDKNEIAVLKKTLELVLKNGDEKSATKIFQIALNLLIA